MIDRPAFFGTVEVDQMQPLGAVRRPAASHFGRIVAEYSFLRVVALTKPHALATSKINGWKNLHVVSRLFDSEERAESIA
jgi:hypothetical protein